MKVKISDIKQKFPLGSFLPLRIFYVTKINFLVSGNIKLKMCRKVELFNKRMVLGVIVP